MTHNDIYCLARNARTKLSREALSGHVDLRRVLGHAKVLDYLTAQLINLGYEYDSDKADGVAVEDDHDDWADHVVRRSEDDMGRVPPVESAENSDEDSNSSDSSSDSVSDLEGDGNDNGADCEYVHISTGQKCDTLDFAGTAIQVSVKEIDEFGEEKSNCVCSQFGDGEMDVIESPLYHVTIMCNSRKHR